eukprot:7733494-Prorocentrum_lima.AAC.1
MGTSGLPEQHSTARVVARTPRGCQAGAWPCIAEFHRGRVCRAPVVAACFCFGLWEILHS